MAYFFNVNILSTSGPYITDHKPYLWVIWNNVHIDLTTVNTYVCVSILTVVTTFNHRLGVASHHLELVYVWMRHLLRPFTIFGIYPDFYYPFSYICCRSIFGLFFRRVRSSSLFSSIQSSTFHLTPIQFWISPFLTISILVSLKFCLQYSISVAEILLLVLCLLCPMRHCTSNTIFFLLR